MNTFTLNPTTSKVLSPQFCMRRVARFGRSMLERAGQQRWKPAVVKLAGTLTLPVIVFGFYNALSPNVPTKFF
jgi:hypothetical protein